MENTTSWFACVKQLLSKELRLSFSHNQTNYSVLERVRKFERSTVMQIMVFWHDTAKLTATESTSCYAEDMRDIYFVERKSIITLTMGMLSVHGQTGEFYSYILTQTCLGRFQLRHVWQYLLHSTSRMNLHLKLRWLI